MTKRTASLLMLFVVGLMVTGVLLGASVPALEPSGLSGPWLAPVLVVLCQTGALFLGRRFILPDPIARSATRSALMISALVVLTLAAALVVVWAVQWAIRSAALVPPALTLLVWFVLLWAGVRVQQNWHPSAKSSVR